MESGTAVSELYFLQQEDLMDDDPIECSRQSDPHVRQFLAQCTITKEMILAYTR